jgi:hypothetical protein
MMLFGWKNVLMLVKKKVILIVLCFELFVNVFILFLLKNKKLSKKALSNRSLVKW